MPTRHTHKWDVSSLGAGLVAGDAARETPQEFFNRTGYRQGTVFDRLGPRKEGELWHLPKVPVEGARGKAEGARSPYQHGRSGSNRVRTGGGTMMMRRGVGTRRRGCFPSQS